ncbi:MULTISPECIES: hypothetical protein [Clostridium]|uniref:hypothetical protein n=1 Tax=Clostridium TaxID=1485 RepID=UPI00164F042A|nr:MULTISPECIES: hypothetical protein [Clostridium]
MTKHIINNIRKVIKVFLLLFLKAFIEPKVTPKIPHNSIMGILSGIQLSINKQIKFNGTYIKEIIGKQTLYTTYGDTIIKKKLTSIPIGDLLIKTNNMLKIIKLIIIYLIK